MASDPMGTVNTFSTLDIHKALNAGGISPEFDTRLQGLLRSIVEKLHGARWQFAPATIVLAAADRHRLGLAVARRAVHPARLRHQKLRPRVLDTALACWLWVAPLSQFAAHLALRALALNCWHCKAPQRA